MCRNIKPLFNFDPPVTAEEIRAASLQFVRKISGFNKPSKANEVAFLAAIDDITLISTNFLRSLETNAPPKSREEEAAKAKIRAAQREGGSATASASASVSPR
jgi:hypothetical protein